MATILLISKQGDGVPIALRLSQEGHVVKVWVKESKAKSSLLGFKNPSRIGDPKKAIEGVDLILGDMAGLGEICDWFSQKGKLVLGGGFFNDKLELDREYGVKVAKSLMKIKVPKSIMCKTPEESITYLKEAKVPQVIKPLGNAPTGLTLVSSDDKNRTLISYLQTMGDKLTPCLVQEVIKGVELSTEGWFNGEEWVLPFNHTFEKKRFMEGDKGPNTGCMGNLVWPTEGDKLINETLLPLKPLLKKMDYIGPLDVNCIITEKEAYFLEFTSRFGYDAIQAWSELLKEPIFEFLYWITIGQAKEVPHSNEQAIAVRLSLPPWPNFEGTEKLKGIQFLDIPEEAERHVWLSDVQKDKEGTLVCSGVDGVLGCVTARGTSVRECQRRVYRTIKNIIIHPDVQYRSDIGEKVDEKRNQLKSWGWI